MDNPEHDPDHHPDHDDEPQRAAPDPSRSLARLEASGPRRIIGAAVLAMLGAFLIYLALWHPPQSLALRVFLVGFGAFALFGCVRLWHCTLVTLELTATELREEGGRVLARVDQITDVSRGAFAFKPSNGFSLTLKSPGGFVWAPGLWWRVGRRIGVGGVTSAAPARVMAETIAALIGPAK